MMMMMVIMCPIPLKKCQYFFSKNLFFTCHCNKHLHHMYPGLCMRVLDHSLTESDIPTNVSHKIFPKLNQEFNFVNVCDVALIHRLPQENELLIN